MEGYVFGWTSVYLAFGFGQSSEGFQGVFRSSLWQGCVLYEGLDVSKGSVGVLFGVRYGDLESLGSGDLCGVCCYFVGDFQGFKVILYILE